MSLFKRKNSLKKRVIQLESYLGLFYGEDVYGDLEHREDANGWGELTQLKKDVKELKADKKSKK